MVRRSRYDAQPHSPCSHHLSLLDLWRNLTAQDLFICLASAIRRDNGDLRRSRVPTPDVNRVRRRHWQSFSLAYAGYI